MAVDPAIRDHQTWIGYLQPDGLVVSPAALVDAQVLVNKNAAPLQQRWSEFVTEVKQDENSIPVIRSTTAVLREFLEWPDDCIFGTHEERPIPEALKVPLKEFGETLEPTLAFESPKPEDPDQPWLILVQDLPRGTNLDTPRDSALAGWTATPTRRFERLLREAGVPIGLLTNRTHFRLVYAPRGENTGTMTFPVDAMAEIAGRPIVAAFEMLLSRERLLSAPREARLPTLLKRSRDYQARVSTTLAHQVLDALYELLRGFQAADERANGDLLRKELAEDPDSIYAGLLTVLMRLVFLLYAEDRGLMPGSDLYVRNYAIHGLFERLRTDAEQNPDTMDLRYGAWAQIIALCRAIFYGCEHPLMKMPAREGHLFDPERYPFLEGRGLPDNRLPLVSDGTIERVLRNLLLLDGQRLSYRTLDVEQIGSVYETMMGFKLQQADGATIALKPAKAHGAPVPINLDTLLATKATDRKKSIQDQTDYKLTTTMTKAVKDAESVDDLLAGLEKRIARNATPQPVSEGTMVLMPTDERRKTGSHYTPRSLTEPIVRKTLEPILKQLGDNPTPDQILDLKVCDPAMGSGAFLVEACRQLADELVKAWVSHGWKPQIPPDEDELLHARRLIAQRCLYGVDRNPMAVDLAKLSIWLATLAKDHPFTFLDHNLKCGDSLVGLTREQIAGFDLKATGQHNWLLQKIRERMERVARERRQILESGDNMPPAAKRQKLAVADEALSLVRLAGDAVVAAFFAGKKPKDRKEKRDELFSLLAAWLQSADSDARRRLGDTVETLRAGEKPITPLHWEIEFPEVFTDSHPGFDAFVGNPPFAGKNSLIDSNREGYLDWLKTTHDKSHGTSDLVAHFFRRAFSLLTEQGCFGLIATNTIGQGDTRATGLRWICTNRGTIYAAKRRYKWPGHAAVVVSIVHACRGTYHGAIQLDGRSVPIITAYLFHQGGHENPEPLEANRGKSFIGCYLLGMGFTFDDSDSNSAASPLSEMERLIANDRCNKCCIFPYIGGEEINDSPRHAHVRYVISFEDWPLRRKSFGTSWKNASTSERREWIRTGIVPDDYPHEVAEDYPELLQIVEERVKPERMRQKDKGGRDKWWQFLRPRAEMHAAIRGLERILVCSRIGNAYAFTFLPTGVKMNEKTVVFPFATPGPFALLQSRVHEVWARLLSSSLKDDLQYTPSECFENFPFPSQYESDSRLAEAGAAYFRSRSELMIRRQEGLTRTYNRFHNPGECSADIAHLRELHADMDHAVLEAYDWGDLVSSGATACGFGLDYLDVEDDELPDVVPETLWWPTAAEALAFAAKLPPSRKRLPWRYRWHDDTRDEVLARLLKLNAERAEEERRQGLTAEAGKKRKTKTARRGGRKAAPAAADLFTATSTEPSEALTPVPMLEAVELMVTILDELKPARVQQIAAERMFILAVNQRARELYAQGDSAATTDVTQPAASFRALWQSIVAMNYATLSDSGMVARTSQSITLTRPEHADMARTAVALFRDGEALKRAWPVEVDNVQYVVP